MNSMFFLVGLVAPYIVFLMIFAVHDLIVKYTNNRKTEKTKVSNDKPFKRIGNGKKKFVYRGEDQKSIGVDITAKVSDSAVPGVRYVYFPIFDKYSTDVIASFYDGELLSMITTVSRYNRDSNPQSAIEEAVDRIHSGSVFQQKLGAIQWKTKLEKYLNDDHPVTIGKSRPWVED